MKKKIQKPAYQILICEGALWAIPPNHQKDRLTDRLCTLTQITSTKNTGDEDV